MHVQELSNFALGMNQIIPIVEREKTFFSTSKPALIETHKSPLA
jgi:hypothetical protein